jgi:hypothetical protein
MCPDKVGMAKGKKASFASTSKGKLKATSVDDTKSVGRVITHREQTDRQIKNASRNVGATQDAVRKKYGIPSR